MFAYAVAHIEKGEGHGNSGSESYQIMSGNWPKIHLKLFLLLYHIVIMS